jgi:hypothetical protein
MRGHGGLLSTIFRYCSIQDLRDEGLTEDRLPDDRAMMLIQMCSSWINHITRQWFIPMRLRERVDGRNCNVVQLPTATPILEIFNLRLTKPGLFDLVYPSLAFEVKDRYVQLLDYKSHLPAQPKFVTMDGTFGWLEETFNFAKTTTTVALSPGLQTFAVADSSKFRAGDTLLLGSDIPPDSEAIQVVSVDPSTDSITTDLISVDLPSGTPVVKYGRVPNLIKWATMLLVKDKMVPMGIRGTDMDTEGPRWWADRLNSESVEGYSYNLAAIPKAYGYGGGQYTTGNPEVDDILQQFASSQHFVYIGGLA